MTIKTDKIINKFGVRLWTQWLSTENTEKNTCILISGAGAPAMFWTDAFCEQLISANLNVIRFDHRDQGLSDAIDWDTHPYTLDDLATDVITILNAYDIEKAHVIGHSMGGMIAQWMAIKYPENLKSYTSISAATTGSVSQPPKEVMNILMENQPSQQFDIDLAGFMKSWEMLNGDYPLDDEMAFNYTRDLYIRSKHPVGVAWHHIWYQEKYIDLRNQLKLITTPGLFLHGKKDPLIPTKSAIETQKLTENSKIIVIPKMGHMIFNRELEKLIAQHLINHVKITGDT
jgi:pimeloyl-ACP methyl ester carboxylesterase